MSPPAAASSAERFVAFSATHWVLLGVFVVGAVLLARSGRRQREAVARGRAPLVSRAMAVVLALCAVPGQLLPLLPSRFELGGSLPLQLSDWAWLAAIWALWTRARLPAALTYYWGLSLTLQAIVTPSLGQSFPDPRFLVFFLSHFLVAWAAIYLAFGLGLAPRWREYRLTVLVSLGWALLAYAVSAGTGTNYGYLVRKPGSASLLDPLGPWPVYVLVALAVLLAVWALMTWPWEAVRRRTPQAVG